MAASSSNSNIALVAIIILLNLTVKIFPLAQAAASFKIISDQHRSRDSAAAPSLDLTPQQTFINPASTTHFDDDDDDDADSDEQSRDAGNTYTLVPRESSSAATPRFHWPTSENGAQPAGKLLNKDARLRYKVQAQRTLNSSRVSPSHDAYNTSPDVSISVNAGQVGSEKCRKRQIEDREHEQDTWRGKNKKFLDAGGTNRRGSFEPILLTSDVKVRSDLVLVRDQEAPAAAAVGPADDGNKHTSYDDRLDLLGSLPVKTLSQRVKVVLPSRAPDKNLDQDRTDDYDRERDEKLFILRQGPESIRHQLKNQVKLSPGSGGGGSGDDEGAEETLPSGNNINLDTDDETNPGQPEELTRAADTSSLVAETRKPVRLTVKRKYGLSFSKQPAADSRHDTGPLTQQLRSAPASTSRIRVTVGNGTRPLVVNSRGLITAAKKQPHANNAGHAPATNTGRPYNPTQLFASSQTSQTLNPIETMVTRRPAFAGVKRKPVASLILKQPTVAAVELAPVNHSHHVDTSYTLSPITSTTHADRTHHSTASSQHSFDVGFNRTSGTAAAAAATTTTLASGNFHHNPPYQQHHIGPSSTTPTFVVATPPPTPTPARTNNRFQSGGSGQQPARVNVGHPGGNRNQTSGSPYRRPTLSPYEPGTADLLSEPANMLQVHQRPNAGNNSAPGLAHLQQSLATTSLKPTKIRIKLLNSLFGGMKPHKIGSGSLAANQTSSSFSMHSSGSPAPLLSSTVANNVAALLAQKLTSLMRPPSMHLSVGGHHLPLNSLFGFRVGPQTATSLLGPSKFKHPFAVASQASSASSSVTSPLNSGINRRTTGVGPLLVSGLIYGLTVLPALMALTGINPLSSDSSGPLGSAALVASRQQHQHQHQNSEKRSKQAKSARQRPGRDTGRQHSMLLGESATANSDAFAYLLPLLSAPATGTTPIQSADPSQPLGSLSLASALEPMHAPPASGHLSRDEAQSSALKSLYAPPPTVLESFGATSSGGADFSSLLEDQPASEIEWPTTGGYMPAADDTHHSQRHQPPLYRPELSWPMSSGAPGDSQQQRSPFVRRNRDLPNERGQWRTTSGGAGSGGDSGGGNSGSGRNQLRPDYAMRDSSFGAIATATTTTTPQPPSASFDDRSATMSGSSFQPQQATRQVSQIALPPPPSTLSNGPMPDRPSAAQQSWSVGMVAPNRGTQHGAQYVGPQQVAQSDRFRQQVNYLVDAQQQQLRQRQQQQQFAQLGDSDGDLAILGPYRAEPLTSMQVDFGGLRQRRTAAADMPPPPPTPAPGQPMNLTTNERPWQGDSWTSFADKSRYFGDKSMGILSQAQIKPAESYNQSHGALIAPNWASESDWRAMGPPPPPSSPPSRLPSSSLRQDDGLFHRSQTERSAAVSELGAKKKSNKNKKSSKRKRLTNSSRSSNNNKSQPLANSSTTKAPNGKDEEESELIMAHSMAMGSRVLNEQLTGHHQ